MSLGESAAVVVGVGTGGGVGNGGSSKSGGSSRAGSKDVRPVRSVKEAKDRCSNDDTSDLDLDMSEHITKRINFNVLKIKVILIRKTIDLNNI